MTLPNPPQPIIEDFVAPSADNAPWLRISWPGNPRVRAVVTSRAGGVSRGAFGADGQQAGGGMNLGDHVADDPAAVAANRERLAGAMPAVAPRFLRQVHGVRVADLDAETGVVEADAAVTGVAGVAATVLVADCLPVLFAAPGGRAVAAAHAGWRGLSAGVLEQTLEALCRCARCTPSEVQVFLGPAIGPEAFEVGDEVRTAFVEHDAAAASAFRAGRPGKWWADLWMLARQRLAAAGVPGGAIAGGGHSTHADGHRWYSFRRNATTGRMAACVWVQPGDSDS